VPSTAASSPTAPRAPSFGPAWGTYHKNDQRTGVDSSGIGLSGAHPAWTSLPLDGQIYAEPLVWHDLVIVATENDTLYGLAAASGEVIWSTHVASPVPLADLACGDVDPLGILSTPVIDPVTGHLFAVAESRGASGTIGQELVALDPVTGKVLFSESDDPPGMHAADQQQRAALLVTAGRVYVSYGGLFGDCGTYGGWVVAAPTTAPGALASYRVDTPNQGAIWAPPGPTLDSSGDLLIATGNGESTTNYDFGNGVIKLSPALQVLDSFAPADWAYDNSHDLDLGSTSPALVDGGRLVFIAGKQSEGYLLNEDHLGGIGGQSYAAPVCFTIGGDAVAGDDVYVSCRTGIKDVRVNPATTPPSFTVAWSGPSAAVDPPIVADGLVWSAGGATLYGLNPSTGAVVQQLALGSSTDKFVTPAVGDGVMVMAAGAFVRAFAG
jgi:outer membrane protein assembly factor BamB